MSITSTLSSHHHRCDELFASAEDACANGQWIQCAADFARLCEELEAHFQSEEELLFPAFESASGSHSGPTSMMRDEHRQMRELLAQMHVDLVARDADAYSGGAETLLILMQQHNMKEENILYPMCDEALASSSVGATLQARFHPR